MWSSKLNSKPIISNSKITTTIKIKNINKKTDLFIADLFVKPIFSDSTEDIIYKLNLSTNFNKKLLYWNTQVLLPSETIDLNIEIEIDNIKDVGKNFSLDINYVPYGPYQDNNSTNYYNDGRKNDLGRLREGLVREQQQHLALQGQPSTMDCGVLLQQ